ncbi:MAG TPA: hypothetical protein VF113_15190 [Stellaceae bacterium]
MLSLEPEPEEFSPGERVEGPDLLPGRPCTLLESCDGDADGAVEEPLEPMLLEPELCSFAAGPDLLPGWPATPGFDVPPEPGAFCICSSDFDDGLVVVCDQAGIVAVINAAAAATLMIFLMHASLHRCPANKGRRGSVPPRRSARVPRLSLGLVALLLRRAAGLVAHMRDLFVVRLLLELVLVGQNIFLLRLLLLCHLDLLPWAFEGQQRRRGAVRSGARRLRLIAARKSRAGELAARVGKIFRGALLD